MDRKELVRRMKANHGELIIKLMEEMWEIKNLTWNVDPKTVKIIRTVEKRGTIFYEEKRNIVWVVKFNDREFSAVGYREKGYFRDWRESAYIGFGDNFVLMKFYAREFGEEFIDLYHEREKIVMKEYIDEYIALKEKGLKRRVNALRRYAKIGKAE